jgi:sortase A
MVSETQIVKPTDVEVMASTPDPTLTLISCYPYMIDNKRIIVRATLEKSEK